MVSYVWSAPGGGDWNNASDWTPAGIPSTLDTVDFATGGSAYTVTGDGFAAALTVDTDSVTFEGDITALNTAAAAGFSAINGAFVTLDVPAIVVASSLSFDPGTFLEINGRLTDNGNGALRGGNVDTAEVSGTGAVFTTAAAVTFNQLYVNQGASFAGNVALIDGGNINIDTSAMFGGGTLSLDGNATFYVANAVGQTSGSYALSEAITIATAGDGLMLAADPGVALSVSGGIAGAGYVDVSSGTVVFTAPNTYTGGTLVQDASLTLTGTGAAGTGAVFLVDAALTMAADSSGGAGAETVAAGGSADTVTATAGNLLLFGAAAAQLSVQGGSGVITVLGGSGVLTATSGAGGGIIFGGSSGADVLTAGAGATTLASASGGVLAATGSAADVLVAAGGNTTLNGGSAAGNSVFYVSGSGSTVVETGAGVDTVVAAGGSTQIFAGTGTQDVFLNSAMTQLDFIDGFAGGTMDVVGFASGDTLHLANYASGEAQSALGSAVVAGGNTVITLSDNTHIVLFGVTDLGSGSFV